MGLIAKSYASISMNMCVQRCYLLHLFVGSKYCTFCATHNNWKTINERNGSTHTIYNQNTQSKSKNETTNGKKEQQNVKTE